VVAPCMGVGSQCSATRASGLWSGLVGRKPAGARSTPWPEREKVRWTGLSAITMDNLAERALMCVLLGSMAARLSTGRSTSTPGGEPAEG